MAISLYAALALATGLFAIYTALLLLGFFSVGRWQQHRHFVGIALSAGIFSALEALHNQPLSPFIETTASRIQLVCAGVQVACWAAYAGLDLGPLPGWQQRAFERGALALGFIIAFAPGMFDGRIRTSSIPALSYSYRAADLSFPGVVLLGCLCCGMLVIGARYLVAAIEGRPQAHAHLSAIFIIVFGATTDVLTLAGAFELPRILQTCIAFSVLPIAIVLTLRWRQDVVEHEQLQMSLERMILERTRDLTETQRVLGRTEKLAAVGRLAGGMAHEINNPGAALIANLEYLSLGLARGKALPPDSIDTLHESLLSARRIARTVRQLLLLSRTAIAESEGHSFELHAAVSLAVQAVRQSRPEPSMREVLVEESIPRDLRLRGRGALLEQALRELLEQLIEAAPTGRASHLRFFAKPDAGRICLSIDADFRGLTDETRALLAEPFQGGKGNSPGPSLGLSASLGLLRTLGADVQLEENNGCTRVMILLEQAPPSSTPPATQPMAEA